MGHHIGDLAIHQKVDEERFPAERPDQWLQKPYRIEDLRDRLTAILRG